MRTIRMFFVITLVAVTVMYFGLGAYNGIKNAQALSSYTKCKERISHFDPLRGYVGPFEGPDADLKREERYGRMKKICLRHLGGKN